MKQHKLQIYTVIMATLLMDWRQSHGISRYEVAKQSGIHINTIKRLEDSEGGITFEDGLRYLLFAETHKSKPCLMKKFISAMANFQSQAEQAKLIESQQKQRQAAAQSTANERRKIELQIRKTVEAEMESKLAELTTQHETEQAEAMSKIAELEQQLATEKSKKWYTHFNPKSKEK